MKEQPHILVIDDDTRLRDLLRQFLGMNGFRVTTAADTTEARAKMLSLLFDLLVVDVMMPGEDGLAFTEFVRRRSRVPILLLTAMGEPDERIRGLECGADDYLAKPFEPRELYLRIESILRRTGDRNQIDLVRFGDCVYNFARGELRRDGNIIGLTTIETVLLSTLARNSGATFTREELKKTCRIDGTERAVDVQITRLRRKIEKRPGEPSYLRTVRGQGYVLYAD